MLPHWLHLELLRHKSGAPRTDISALFTGNAAGYGVIVLADYPTQKHLEPAGRRGFLSIVCKKHCQ